MNENTLGDETKPSIWKWSWLLPIIVIFVLAEVIVYRFGVHQPFSDEFSTPGRILYELSQGRFSWKDLWAWHNEAHMVFPKILWIIEALAVGWHVKTWMYFGVILTALEVVLLCLLLEVRAFSEKTRWLLGLAFALILLHPCNAPGTFLRGSQYIAIVPGFLLVLGSFINIKASRLGTLFASYCALSTIGTLTFPNGMALWVLLYPYFPVFKMWGSGDRDLRKKIIGYSLASFAFGLALIGCYFIGYSEVRQDAGLKLPHPDYVGYFFKWMGAPLALHFKKEYSAAFGYGVTALSLILPAFLFLTALVRRMLGRIEVAWPWLMLIAYGLLSATASSLGRASIPQDQSVAGRYFLISLQLVAGILGLWLVLAAYEASGAVRRRKVFSQSLIFATLGLVLVFELGTWNLGYSQSAKHLFSRSKEQLALNLWDEAPLITPIPFFIPTPPSVRPKYLTLIETGFLKNQGDGIWLSEALKVAADKKPIGEVRVNGQGENLRVSSHLSKVFAKCPNPALLTTLRLPDGTLAPVAVDLMSPQVTKKGLPGLQIYTKPFRNNVTHCQNANDLVFFALDPMRKKAYLLKSVIK
ncbi:MAG: hypothetical protein ABIT76_07465 [Chthoniobacterales bacterium]